MSEVKENAELAAKSEEEREVLADISVLPEYQSPEHNLSLYVSGEPLPTSIDGFFIRQPLPEDRIQAEIYESEAVAVHRLESKNIQKLEKYPASREEKDDLKEFARKREKALTKEVDPARKKFLHDRIEQIFDAIEDRTAAQSKLDQYGAEMRNLWYVRHLLIDEEGDYVDSDSLSPSKQQTLFEDIDGIMRDISLLPFVSME